MKRQSTRITAAALVIGLFTTVVWLGGVSSNQAQEPGGMFVGQEPRGMNEGATVTGDDGKPLGNYLIALFEPTEWPDFLKFHNDARTAVGIKEPLVWSDTIARNGYAWLRESNAALCAEVKAGKYPNL